MRSSIPTLPYLHPPRASLGPDGTGTAKSLQTKWRYRFAAEQPITGPGSDRAMYNCRGCRFRNSTNLSFRALSDLKFPLGRPQERLPFLEAAACGRLVWCDLFWGHVAEDGGGPSQRNRSEIFGGTGSAATLAVCSCIIFTGDFTLRLPAVVQTDRGHRPPATGHRLLLRNRTYHVDQIVLATRLYLVRLMLRRRVMPRALSFVVSK